MRNKEIEETRCLIAKVISIPPDDIDIYLHSEDIVMFGVYFRENEWTFNLFYSSKPTAKEIEDTVMAFKNEAEKWEEEYWMEKEWEEGFLEE